MRTRKFTFQEIFWLKTATNQEEILQTIFLGKKIVLFFFFFFKHKSSPHRYTFNSEASRGGFHCCFKCPLWVSLVNQLQQRNQKPHRENVMAANSICLSWSLGHLLWHFSSPLFIVPLSFTATACRHVHQPEIEVSALPSPVAAFLCR